MNTTVDLSGLDKITEQLRTLDKLDATPLMLSWMIIMEEDNRRGVLAGLDKDGVPMRPVTYRPKVVPAVRVAKPQKGDALKNLVKRFRNGERATAQRGLATGFGPYAAGLHNNLTTRQYQMLGGPPLAPRDQFSRVITNYKTDFAEIRPGFWTTTFWWEDVVNSKGQPFLRYHFDGTSKLPRRDLRGVRPTGVAKALDALKNWARDVLRTHFS